MTSVWEWYSGCGLMLKLSKLALTVPSSYYQRISMPSAGSTELHNHHSCVLTRDLLDILASPPIAKWYIKIVSNASTFLCGSFVNAGGMFLKTLEMWLRIQNTGTDFLIPWKYKQASFHVRHRCQTVNIKVGGALGCNTADCLLMCISLHIMHYWVQNEVILNV